MGYKLAGNLSDSARIIIINESDWSIEANTLELPTTFEVFNLTSGTKSIIARTTEGEVFGYGLVNPIYHDPFSRGLLSGGIASGNPTNIIEYITIDILGNAIDFGDLSAPKDYVVSTSNGSNDRGIIAAGNYTVGIEYVTISTTGNSQNFGNLTAQRYPSGATSNGVNDRGLVEGNMWYYTSSIDYITISTTGNAQNFGNLSSGRTPSATSNGVNDRGIFVGGCFDSYVLSNTIDYVTISTTGNATDFGDATISAWMRASTSNGTNNRGVTGGGYNNYSGNDIQYDVIDYVTISTTGNAVDFGDLSSPRHFIEGATSNTTNDRGVFCGGHTGTVADDVIDYITISTTGNAQDFGNLTKPTGKIAATSNA